MLSEKVLKYIQEHSSITLLHYVDDLFLAEHTLKECKKTTEEVIEMLLQQLDYHVSV